VAGEQWRKDEEAAKKRADSAAKAKREVEKVGREALEKLKRSKRREGDEK